VKARIGWWSCTLVLVVSFCRSAAGEPEDVNVVEKKAMAAFALGRYAEAAESFEKAFELKTEPALLYNAAQAHRLAGHKERALSLYENYVRVFGKHEHRAEVEARIVELKQAIEQDKAAATPPPANQAPAAATEPPPSPPPGPALTPGALSPAQPPAEAGATPVTGLVVSAKPPSADDQRPLVKKPWFWAAVGGGVIVVVLSALLLSGGSQDPNPSIGHASGN
jgi:tetratricopeptide (TPR) repeat protein